MRFKINTKGLNSLVKPKITTTVSDLASARNNLTGLKKPENFSKGSQLNNIQNRISQVEKNVSEINSYIVDKVKDFEDAERKASQSVNDLEKTLAKLGSGFGGGMFGNLGQQNTTASKTGTSISSSVMNNLDYQYYIAQQKDNKSNMYLYSEAYLEQKYGKSMAKVRETNTSSIINLFIGGVKGVSKAGETTADGYMVGQANSISINNPDWRYFTNGDKSKIDEYARQYKRETMIRVSKDYTQSWYNNFYNTKIGKDLDKKAGTPFKSDGAATKFATNMTYRGTLMATGGNPLGVGFLGYLSGKGEATQSYWSQAKIQAQIKSGKNIDKIFETGNDYGNAKGTWTGISMAFQKATGSGGKVDKILNKAWKRVLADATAGGLEVPATAYANSKINGKSFKESFEEEGGLKAVGINAGSSGAVSLLGELVRWRIGNAKNIKDQHIQYSKSMNYENLNEVDIENILSKAKENQKKFWKGYVSEEQIDNDFKSIKLYNQKEWNEIEIIKLNPEAVGFYNTVDGTINIRIENNALINNIVEHEHNHKIGNLNLTDFDDYNRGMNEAVTEYFALRSSGDDSYGLSAYAYNVSRLEEIKQIVDEKVHKIPGYENMDLLKTTYTDDKIKELFDYAIDDIAERDGFSKELRKLMCDADGGYVEDMIEARNEIDKLVDELIIKSRGINHQTDQIPKELWKLID